MLKIRTFWGQNDVKGRNLEKMPKKAKKISKSLQKLFHSGLWAQIWCKMKLLGSILSKYVIFGENGKNRVSLGAKIMS